MKELQLMLVPAPGAKPEFLAMVQPVSDDGCTMTTDATAKTNTVAQVWASIGNTVVLEGYTRDGWAWKPMATPPPDGCGWTTLTVESTDGRNKLPGFVGYLKERQKSAYARFGATGVWIVSYVQPKRSSSSTTRDRIDVRIATDFTKIPNCTLQPRHRDQGLRDATKPETTKTNGKSSTTPPSNPTASLPSTTTTSTRKPGGGLLGKLVGAQQRTNEYVAIAKAPRHRTAAATTTTNATPGHDNGAATHQLQQSSTSLSEPKEFKSVPEVFAAFRQSCQDLMLDFDMSNDELLRVPIVISDQLKWLATDEEKARVTMDVLKYMVYEAAEEVNEEWVAHKEPSEFMDEVVIAVYKEGAAPPEVLEEINKGELPDEIRGQQRAIQEQRLRSVTQAEQKQQNKGIPLVQQQHPNDEDGDDDDGLEALNTKKRDRRTVADYEREKMEAALASKRSR
jgi:hypothetical protein